MSCAGPLKHQEAQWQQMMRTLGCFGTFPKLRKDRSGVQQCPATDSNQRQISKSTGLLGENHLFSVALALLPTFIILGLPRCDLFAGDRPFSKIGKQQVIHQSQKNLVLSFSMRSMRFYEILWAWKPFNTYRTHPIQLRVQIEPSCHGWMHSPEDYNWEGYLERPSHDGSFEKAWFEIAWRWFECV